ncbi:exonuclease [Dehalococcoides mccartyi CG4]|uniref:ribonuclease H-like domain-containing protein n=1 Tax=Dehalococcoides mccartyi TaxID=61435 RepID=UPI0004E09128|nr:ribonuclease H-like domain-containing protein [Dehalococcoides mccartyi]AII59945.1 exonuclease [Dehalococcoides mccartyi CG4]
MEAYLDIETTGLSPYQSELTVIGIHLVNGDSIPGLIQLVGKECTAENVMASLAGTDILYTYNGKGFDLPFIHRKLGIDLSRHFNHRDLMFDCWDKNLKGGLKKVECQLGISRELTEVNGYVAVQLWWSYINNFDTRALKTLLDYNREDVVNLKTLKDMLLNNCTY